MLISKPIIEPLFALMSVQKRWVLGSPEPRMFLADGFFPGLLFSQAIGFTPAPQKDAALARVAPVDICRDSTILRIAPRAARIGRMRRSGVPEWCEIRVYRTCVV